MRCSSSSCRMLKQISLSSFSTYSRNRGCQWPIRCLRAQWVPVEGLCKRQAQGGVTVEWLGWASCSSELPPRGMDRLHSLLQRTPWAREWPLHTYQAHVTPWGCSWAWPRACMHPLERSDQASLPANLCDSPLDGTS